MSNHSEAQDLNYSTHLIDRADFVRKHDQKRRKGVEELIEILTLRYYAELHYSNQLLKIGNSSYMSSYEGSLGDAILALKEDCVKRSQISSSLLQKMKEHILDPLKSLIQDQKKISKTTGTAMEKTDSDFKEIKEKLSRSKIKYKRSMKDIEDTLAYFDQIIEFKEYPEDKKNKINNKINFGLKLAKEAERNYKSHIFYAKEYRQQYISNISTNLETYEKMEEKRISQIKLHIGNLFGFESIADAELAKSMKTLPSCLEKVNQRKDIEEFISHNKSENSRIEDFSFEKYFCKYDKVFMTYDEEYFFKGKDFNYAQIYQQLKDNYEQQLSEIQKEERQITISMGALLNKCWDSTSPEQQELKNFHELSQNKNGRKIFCDCLNKYRKNGQFAMSDKCYSDIVGLMNTMLDIVFVNYDVETALSLMILSQTFFTEEPSTFYKKFLQIGIQGHRLWKSTEFWEKAIRTSIEEELDPQNPSAATNDLENEMERVTREKNSIFGKLGTFAHNMLSFKIDKEHVRSLISKFSKEFSLPELHVLALEETIEKSQPKEESKYKAPPQRDMKEWIKDIKTGIEEEEKESIAEGKYNIEEALRPKEENEKKEEELKKKENQSQINSKSEVAEVP